MNRSTRWLLAALLVVLALPLPLALAARTSAPSGRIAIIRNPTCPEGPFHIDCGKGEVAVMGAGGGGLTLLTHDSVGEDNPVWSPNGQQIAFIKRSLHASDQIWVMNADGTSQTVLTNLSRQPDLIGNENQPELSWSPDGQAIVFAAFPTGAPGQRQLYLLNVRTHGVTRLTHVAGGATNPAWSPDGKWIAFVEDTTPGRVFFLSPQTHEIHLLKTRSGAAVKGVGIAWSPNGHTLAFNAAGALVAFDTGTHTFRTLAAHGRFPSWSPDGKWVVFMTHSNVRVVGAYGGTGSYSILHFNEDLTRYDAPDWG